MRVIIINVIIVALDGDDMAKDPVCNMDVNPKSPGATETYHGKTYYFCCESCKTTFDKNPDKYASKA